MKKQIDAKVDDYLKKSNFDPLFGEPAKNVLAQQQKKPQTLENILQESISKIQSSVVDKNFVFEDFKVIPKEV